MFNRELFEDGSITLLEISFRNSEMVNLQLPSIEKTDLQIPMLLLCHLWAIIWLCDRLTTLVPTSVDMTLMRLCQGMVSSSPPTVLTASEKSQSWGFRLGLVWSWDGYEIDSKVRLKHFMSICSLSPHHCHHCYHCYHWSLLGNMLKAGQMKREWK